MFRTRRHTSLFRKKSTEPNPFYLPTSQLIFLLLHKTLKNFHPQCTIAIKQRHRSRRQLKVMMIRMILMMIPMLTHRLLKAGEVRNRTLKDPPVLSSATPVSVGYTFISQVFKYKLTSKVYPLGVSQNEGHSCQKVNAVLRAPNEGCESIQEKKDIFIHGIYFIPFLPACHLQ